MNDIIRTELLPGTTLCGGKYIIEKKIGAGGFGITYLAKHSTLEKKYAIKEFFLSGYNVRNNQTNHISLQGIEEKDFDKFKQRFINEARTLASLNNDAVVKVVDIFDENGTSYMVMPFVEGITLQRMVEENGPMEYEMAVNYIVRICDALSYIHSKNILHRDVTPDNIIVTPEQKTILIDFGSARKFIDNKTQRHTTILKQGYAPLEQYSATSRKGAYTDLYSLGGVFYFILTGVRPIDATERTMEKMKEPIELNPNIPEQINAVIMKAMEMDSSDRYQSARELEEDILSGNIPEKKDMSLDHVTGENTQEKNKIKRTRFRKLSRFLILPLLAIAIIFLFFLFAGESESKTNNCEAEINSTLKEDGLVISIDSLLREDEDTIIQRLNINSSDPAALFSLAHMVYYNRYSHNSVRNFWDEKILTNFDINSLIETNQDCDIYDFFPKNFAVICAAIAYENLDNCTYSIKVKEELKDSICELLEKLNNEGYKSRIDYAKK